MKLKTFLVAIAAMVTVGVNAQSWTGNEVAAGTFYLYNVGAGKFLNNGDPNSDWGTNAYLQAGFGMDVVLANVGEGLYTIDTNVSNGGNDHYMNSSTWTDGAATQWQFRAVDGETNTYQIVFDGQYLMATEALNDVEMAANPGSRVTSTYWKLVSEQDFKDAMVAKAYSSTDPMDVSIFIKGRSFARNDGRNNTWVRTYQNANNQKWIEGYNNHYYGNEFWNQTFDIHQEITGLPDGTYEVQCSGFGTNGTTFIYGNTKEGALTTENSAAGGSRTTAYRLIADENAWAGQTTGTFTLSGGNLTVGLKRTTNKSADWCVYDEFRLYYYGLDLSEFAATLADAVAAAEAVAGTVPTAAYDVLAGVVTENNKTYTTASAYTAAANAIVEATNAAKALQTNYSRYNTVKAAALAISENVVTSEADAAFAAATTNDAINAAVATLRAAFLAELPNVTIPQDPGYIDVTSVMVDNAGVHTNTDYWTKAGTQNGGYSFGVCNYGECEFYNCNFKFYQTLALTSGTWEFGVTGFHRAGNHKTNFYAGDDKILIPGVGSDVVNNMSAAKDYFDAGNGKVSLKFLMEAADNIEIGIDNQDTETDKWTIFRDFTLKYYGAPDYSTYVTRLNDALDATLSGLDELNGKVPAVITNEAASLETTYRDAELANKAAYLAAIELVEGKLTTAQSLEAPYTAYKAAAAAAETEGVEASLLTTQNEAVEAATTVAAIKDCLAEVQYARMTLAVAEKTNVDLTSFIINPGFEEGNLNGWTNDGNTPLQAQGNKAFGGTVGEYYAERWHVDATLDINQTLTYLPAGLYKVSVNALAEYEGCVLYANTEETPLGATNTYEQLVKVDERGSLKFGAKGGLSTSTWFCVDNFTLTYVAEDFVYTLVEGKLNATIAEAQTSAETTFNSEKSIANYLALLSAIDAAQASKDAYTAAAAALTKANSILNSTNVYTAEARTAYADAIAAAQETYDDNSMTTETASGLNAALNTADWGATQPTGAAYIGSAWTGTNINFNFWSWEGDGEGASGMSTPFVQYWVADAEKLANNTITATLSGLENGLYSVTAFVRAFNNKEGDDAGYDGISLAVNEGTPVAFADATEYTDGWAKEITAEGLVKGGILTITFATDGTNASWLAFKNVNYTKVRDLTEEELAVAPTAITLYNGEDEVTENIILNGSETTVTLNTVLAPAEATPGFIEWESADENVASVSNGVIKANGTGTTTITARSTIDPAITATATVVAYAFQNQSFEADGNQAAGNSTNPNMITITGWTQEQNTAGSYQDNQLRDATTDNNSNYGKRVTPSDGSYYFFYRHGWNGSNYAKLTSVAQNLPIGKYTLTVDYKMVAGSDNTSNNDNTAITLSAISGEKTLASTTKNDATKANSNSSTAYLTNEAWKTVSTSFILEEATSVQAVINLMACGPKRSDFVVDNVTLTWSSFKDELNDAIAVAEAVDVTTNVGDAVFQIPASAVSTFNTAISDAQGVYDDAESTESNYLDAIKALDDAKTAYANAELNAPDAEQLYNIVVATADHAKENNPIIIIPGATAANNPTGYALNANLGSNGNLSQAFTFTQVEGNSYKISAKVAGVDVYLTNGTLNGSAAGWKNSQIQATTDAEKAMAFKVGVADVEGAFVIYNTETNSTIACQTGGNIYTEAGNANFKLVETSKPSIAINTTAAGWGTVMLPFAQELPEGVKAYSVSEVVGEVLTLVEVNALEANKPYIIGGAWEETLTGDAQGTALTYTEGLLTGVYASQLAPVGSYVLQNNNDRIGFYEVADDEQPTVGANRAYLTVENAAGVKAFFFDSTATAIQNVMSGAAAGEIYDLSGRKVSKMQRGNTYIVNGQKVMVK